MSNGCGNCIWSSYIFSMLVYKSVKILIVFMHQYGMIYSVHQTQWRGHGGFGGQLRPTFAKMALRVSSKSIRK